MGSHKSQVKMEGLTTTTTPETLVNLEEPPPLDFANISSTETTTPELPTSILTQTMQTLLHNGTTLSPEILQDLKDTTTENLEALARNETIGEQELKEWQKTMYEIKQIFQGGSLYPNNIDWNETPDGIKLEHWMVVSILTPCIVALYLILIMVAYHTFCKVSDCSQDNPIPNGQIETISGGLIEESLTPPPAYAITIESGESLFQPPSYKMIFPSTYSFSQDSYGGLPDFSCFSAVSSDHHSLASPLQSPRSPRNSLTSTSPLILTGGSVTPASSTCPNTPSRPLWETRRTSTSEYNLLRVQNLSGLDENNVYEFDSQT